MLSLLCLGKQLKLEYIVSSKPKWACHSTTSWISREGFSSCFPKFNSVGKFRQISRNRGSQLAASGFWNGEIFCLFYLSQSLSSLSSVIQHKYSCCIVLQTLSVLGPYICLLQASAWQALGTTLKNLGFSELLTLKPGYSKVTEQ